MSDRDAKLSLRADYLVARVEVEQRLDINHTTRTIQEMSPEYAATIKQIALYQHAVPAQEETKRSKQVTWRLALGGVVAVAGFVAMAIVPAIAWPASLALAFLETAIVGSHWVDRKAEAAPGLKRCPKRLVRRPYPGKR